MPSSNENTWLKKHKLVFEDELYNSTCLMTKRCYAGVLDEITYALVDTPKPKVIWWYKNPKNGNMGRYYKKENII
jgi:hypothetical protein